jgi:hypothetical protein
MATGSRHPEPGWLQREWLWILAVAGGTVLRLWQLSDQVLADDEWHAVRTALVKSFVEILSDFSVSATIPVAFSHKIMYATVGISELSVRLPWVLCGLATLVVLPWLVRPHVGAPTSRVFAAMLAISPLLVYFSRYARPYSASLLLSFVGLVAFYRWWMGGRRGWAVLFVITTVLSTYLHLTALFALMAPFAFAVVDLSLRRRSGDRRSSLIELVVLGLATVVGLAAVLAVPVALDWGAIAARAGSSDVGIRTLIHTMALFAGTGQLWVAALFAITALAGAVILIRRDAGFTAHLVWACFVAVIGSSASRAEAVSIPIVFARYTLVLLPVLLLLVAAAVEALMEVARARTGSLAAAALPAAIVITLLAQGPLPAIYYRPNNWTNHAIFQYSYDPSGPYSYVHEVRPRRIPDFYRRLSDEPRESLVIVEAPFFYEWYNNPFPFYQKVHRQKVRAGVLGQGCRQAGSFMLPRQGRHRLRLRTIVATSRPEQLVAAGADYLVLHKNLREELRPEPYAITQVPHSNIPRKSTVGECIEGYRELYGPVVFEDQDIVVFALSS